MGMLRSLTAAGLLVGSIVTTGPITAQDTYTINCIFPYWTGFAPTFLARDLGYFEDEGLEVNITFDDDRGNVLPAMVRGDIDCSQRTVGEYLTRPRTPETPGTIIGAIDLSLGADGVIASGEVETVADLEGKVFAAEPNHPAYMLIQYALRQQGASWSEVDYRPIQTADAIAVFEDPSIDAVGMFEPMLSQTLKATSREGAHILLDSGDYPGLIVDVIVIRDEQLQANPEKYAGFLRAIYRAIDYYNENPEKAKELMAPHYNLSVEEFQDSLDVGVEYTSYERALEMFGTPEEPGPLYATFDELMDIALEHDLNDVRLSAEESIDNSFPHDLWQGHER